MKKRLQRRSRSVGSRARNRRLSTRGRSSRRRKRRGGSSIVPRWISFTSLTLRRGPAPTPKFGLSTSSPSTLMMKGESLILTGPTRGIVVRTDAYFEINLKIKQDRESEDRQFSKTLIDVDSATIDYKVKTQTTVSWLSEVDLMFSYVKKALEGTIEIRILSGSSSFHGRVTVCTTDIASHILLYDSDVHGANTMGNDRVLKLLRRVVSVSVDQMLIFHIYPCSGDSDPRIFEITPRIKGADKVEITCGGHRTLVKVTWSILSVRGG